MKAVTTKKFDTKSPGFLYSSIVAVLTVFAVSGVSFPKTVDVLGMEITTSLSAGGIYAIFGVVLTSVAFLFGYPPEKRAQLTQDYLRVTRKARSVVERVFYEWE